MTFDQVTSEAYDRFMGRFSTPLAAAFADWLGLRPGQRALDVGCGPGALTTVLVARLGAEAVEAVDPSTSFVAAMRDRLPEVPVRQAGAEDLPYPDGRFDAAVAQLVVHFMTDPVAGLREMGRVVRPGGTVAASVWDHSGGTSPLGPFWDAAAAVDPAAPGEADFPGAREGHLAELASAAGLTVVESSHLDVTVRCATYEDWWDPMTLGVGPVGAYVAGLDEAQRRRLREACRERLPEAPFDATGRAWTVRATA